MVGHVEIHAQPLFGSGHGTHADFILFRARVSLIEETRALFDN